MRGFLLVSAFSLAAHAAQAQEVERYRLEKTDKGYVRMDTVTGAMSICEERSGQLVCKMAADERTAFQDEVDRLRGDIKAIEDRVAKLEKPILSLPTDEEFDRTMIYMEKFFRNFMDIVKDSEKDEAPSPGGVPQKT